MKQSVQVIWFDYDLRTHDHEGLWKAAQKNTPILGIYLFDMKKLEPTKYGFPKISAHRLQFIHESLIDLKNSCEKLNIPLHIFISNETIVFDYLLSHFEIQTVYHQKAYGSEEKKIYRAVQEKYRNLIFYTYDTKPLYHIEDFPLELKLIPDQFTKYRQIIEKKGILRLTYPTIKSIDQRVEANIEDDFLLFGSLYQKNINAIFQGGETNAVNRVNYYFFETKKLKFYKQTRNQMLKFDDSSKLSPYLAFGCVSPRYINEKIKEFEVEHGENISTYWLYFELLWRDYFHYVHVKYKNKIFYRNGLYDRDYQVEESRDYIKAWKEGVTGYPLVDANMIEINVTGFMSNRGRQNVASFFTKYIKQDWRIGAAWFEYQLIDYDVSSNYGNWQYQAGLGVDPREDRIFDVIWQGNQYDAQTTYLRKWLPQFKSIPKEHRYSVMMLKQEDQNKYNFKLGVDYPYPIIDKPNHYKKK